MQIVIYYLEKHFFQTRSLDNILLLKVIKLWFTGASCGLMAHILGCSKQNIVNTINKLQIFNIYEGYFKDVKQIFEETTLLKKSMNQK